MNIADRCKELNDTACSYDYWDARLLGAYSDAFLSRLVLFQENDEKSVVRYSFGECYQIQFIHADEEVQTAGRHRWPPENYTYPQIDYFIHDISFSPKQQGSNTLIECRVDAGIATLYILCGRAEIQLLNIEELPPKERANIVLWDGAGGTG